MVKVACAPSVPALSNAFEALTEVPGKTEPRPQPTILDAIRWRSSATQGSRRDFLKQKKVFVSDANHSDRHWSCDKDYCSFSFLERIT